MVPAVAKSGVRCTVLYQYHGSVSAEVQESSGVRGSTKGREREDKIRGWSEGERWTEWEGRRERVINGERERERI